MRQHFVTGKNRIRKEFAPAEQMKWQKIVLSKRKQIEWEIIIFQPARYAERTSTLYSFIANCFNKRAQNLGHASLESHLTRLLNRYRPTIITILGVSRMQKGPCRKSLTRMRSRSSCFYYPYGQRGQINSGHLRPYVPKAIFAQFPQITGLQTTQ